MALTRLDDKLFFGHVVFLPVTKSPCRSLAVLARPPIESRSVSGLRYALEDAGVAQLAEQLLCKQVVCI